MKIAFLSDLHYSKKVNVQLPVRKGHLGDVLLLRAILRFNKFIHPDLVIFGGDLLNDPQETEELETLAAILKRLEAPSVVIPGNHDPAPDIFYRYIAKPPEFMDFGHLRFIPFLDRETPGYNALRSKEDLVRMKTLSENFNGKIVSIQHVPLFPEGHSSCPYVYENAAEILSAHGRPAVSFNGHYHTGDLVKLPGLVSVTAPALCENDFPYLVIELNDAGELVSVERETLRLPVDGLYDTHVHTHLAYCQENMDKDRTFELAKAFNLRGFALTEHSGQLYVSNEDYWGGVLDRNGLGKTRIQRRVDDYFALLDENRRLRGDFISGFELDMDAEGRVILEDADSKRASLRLGAVHFLTDSETREKAVSDFLFRTERLCESGIDILAHPFRTLIKRGYPDTPELYPVIADLLKRTNTAAEINYHDPRVPDDGFFRLCAERGVKLALGSDSHNLCEIGEFYPHLKLLRRLGLNPDTKILYNPRKGI